MQEPSLLDWLNGHLGQPKVQRLARFGLAGVAALAGLLRLLNGAGQEAGGFLLMVLAAALAVWGLGVRAPSATAGSSPGLDLPGLSLGVRPSPSLHPAPDLAERRAALSRTLATLRLPTILLLALLGQAALASGPTALSWGLGLYGLALLLFVATLLYDRLLGAPPAEAAPALAGRLTFRWVLLATALAAGLFAFLAASGNRFRTEGVLAWLIAIGAWLAATWETTTAP